MYDFISSVNPFRDSAAVFSSRLEVSGPGCGLAEVGSILNLQRRDCASSTVLFHYLLRHLTTMCCVRTPSEVHLHSLLPSIWLSRQIMNVRILFQFQINEICFLFTGDFRCTLANFCPEMEVLQLIWRIEHPWNTSLQSVPRITSIDCIHPGIRAGSFSSHYYQ
jgi:hypothetical protein